MTARQSKASQRRNRMHNAAPGPVKRKQPAHVSLLTRLRYRFDNAMARGPLVVILYLAALSILVIVVGAEDSVAVVVNA